MSVEMDTHGGPAHQQMNEGAPMGENGWGSVFAETMDNPRAFSIKHMIPRTGFCYTPICYEMCCPKLKGRGYIVIGDNFFEKNDPICFMPCCMTIDCISKTYFDRQPFADTCCEKICACCVGDGSDNFVTEHDTCYCCYCIPCMPVYDICVRPCYGGTLGRAVCSRDKSCMFFCGTRCCACISPIANYVDDSKKAKEILENQLKIFRAKGGSDVALS